jgi:signal transduction histidine kinase
LLNDLSAHYLFTNTTGARNPAIESLDLSEKTGNSKGKMDALSRLGIMHYRLANYDSSIIFYQKGLLQAESVKDTTYILKYRGNIALSLSSEGKYQEALKEYFSIIDLQKKYNPLVVSKNMLDMASIYYHLNDFENALKTAQEARSLAEKYNDQRTLSNAYGSIGVFLHHLGKDGEAMKYHRISYRMKKEQQDISGQINSLINISLLLEEKGDYVSSLGILDTIVVLAREAGSARQLANAMTNKGVLYTELEHYEKAYEAFKEALTLYTETGSLKDIAETNEKLGINSIRRKKYEEAAMYLKAGMELKDSLYRQNMADAIAEMRTRFETEKKEQENARLVKENELNARILESEKREKKIQLWLFASGVLVILLVSLLLFFRYRNKKRTEMEKQRNLGLKAVIEAEEKERIRIARDLHDGLGQLLSTARVNMAALEGEVKSEDEKLLGNALNTIDESIKEVRSISHNMMPVALIEFGLIKAVDVLVLRVNEAKAMKITFSHEGIDRLEQSVEISIYRIIQEVLNNMIKHSDARNIMIDLRRSGHKILLKINDDGKGFDSGEIGKSSGMGWNNIYSRLSLINGNMDVHSDPGTGTVINIDFSL